MYNPQELQRKAQLNLQGVDTTAKTTIETDNPPKQDNKQGILVRGIATLGDVVNNVVKGATKSLEGIVDAGAMIVGLFGADVDNFVEYDFTSDVFGADEEGEGLLDWAWSKNLSEASYLKEDSMVNQIAEGVGGMLPAIAVNFIPGVGQALSTTMFIGGASGNASESALQEGATYGQALGYGAMAGAIEYGTEMIGGRAIGKATELTDTAVGKLLIRKGLDKGVSKGAGKLAYTFVSEGVEEVLSDIADPINKKVWGVADTFEMPTVKDLGKTFVVGGSVGAVLDSVGKGASAIRNKSKGGKSFVKVADNLEDISNTTKALAYLQQTKGVSQERFDNATVRSSERMINSIENISEELQSMTEEQRKSAFETLRESTSFVDETFNSDGTIKEDVIDNYADVMNFGAKYNVSSDLVYRGKEIENDIKTVNEEQGVNIELSDSKFTENQRKSFAKINRSVAKLNSKVGEKISIIAIKDNDSRVNAFIDGNNIYINEKHLEDGKWARYLSHEISHFAKKSKEFGEFAEYITKNTLDKKLNELVLQIDENYKYNLNLEGAKKIIAKVQKGEQVSKKESKFYDELVAHITEDLFTNEESVNRLVRDNSGLAKKILNRIKQFLQIFKGTNADTQTVVNLRKAEMFFEKALSSIGKENKELTERYEKGVAEYKKAKETYNKLPENQKESWLKENDWKAEDFADDVMGYDEEVDKEKEKSFSKGTNEPLPDFDTVASLDKWFDGLSFEELQELVNDIEQDIKDVVVETLPISKQARREQFVKKLYEQGKLNQVVTKIVKSKPQMQQYFSDTKMNNKYNPLIPSKPDEYVVMFHGTPEQFNEFDTKKVGKHGSVMGSGLYFTNNYSYAEDYKEYDDGRVIATLLDIKKPLSRNKHEITKEELKTFIRKVVDSNGEDFLSNYGDVYSVGYDKLLNDTVNKLFDYNTNDVDMIEDIYITSRMDFDEFHDGLTDTLGYDGVIAWNKAEGTQAIVFRSNQVKEIFNFKPTKSKDIRFSKSKRVIKYFTAQDVGVLNYNILTNRINALYNKLNDTMADCVAIDVGTTVYYIDTSKYDNFVRIGVRSFFDIPEDTIRKIVIDKINKESYERNYGDNEVFRRLGVEVDNDSRGDISDLSTKNYTNNQREPKDNEGRFYNKTWDKYYKSLENAYNFFVKNPTKHKNKLEEIINEYANYKGYKFNVYHGSRNVFTAFDEEKKGTNTKTQTSKEWFFASDKETANSYYPYGIMKELEKRYPNDKNFNAELLKDKGKLYHLFLKMENPLVVDVEDYDYASHRNDKSAWMEFVEEADKNGNDGIILYNAMDNQLDTSARKSTVYMFRNPNQVKSADLITYDDNGNIIPLSQRFDSGKKDIRFSKSNDGLYQKKVADISKKKVYNKKEAQQVVNTIIENIDLGDGQYVEITNKSQEQIADALWKVLNTNDSGNRVGVSEKIADYLIESLVVKEMYESDSVAEYTNIITELRPYLHNIDLSAIKGEIKYRFDKDNSVYAIWGARKGEKGFTADQIAQKLEENGVYIKSTNEADIFFEINQMYRDAVKNLKARKDKYLSETLEESQIKELRTAMRNEILRSFDEYGSKSKFAKIIEEESTWRELYYREKAVGNLLYEVKKLTDVKEFQNVSVFNNEQFKGSIEKLGRLNWRGNLNESGARKIASTLSSWYTEKNEIVKDRFDKEISDTLEEISNGQGRLLSNEIKDFANVVAYFRKFIETYSKVYRQGKWVEAKPLIEDFIAKMEETKNVKVGWLGNIFGKVFNGKNYSYAQAFTDPMTLARYMDKYGNGFYTQMMETLRQGAVNSEIQAMELYGPIEEFSQENKKYFKELSKRTVIYEGVEITMDKAISLYMTLNRQHALLGLARSGFAFENENGKTVRVDGFATDENLTFDEIQQIAYEVQEKLGRQFNDTDFEYIEILEDLFNVKAKELKAKQDIAMRGYTNVLDDYYFPIVRANISKSIDTPMDILNDRVSNASFNKNIIKGTQSELFINSIETITDKHIKGIAQYCNLAQAIQTYDVLFNLDVSGNKNKPVSIKTESANIWAKGNDYFKTMLEDIQGKNKGGSNAYSFIRSGFAKFQLGANPKVWLTQLSSFFASTSILDERSVVKGIAIKTDDVDKYCKLAQLRNNDNTVAKAQGLIDEVGKVGDILMKPIGKVDRFVVKKLFGACQVQVEKDNGLKVGTEENKVKAGKLLQKVILETQQNSIATEKSQAMRSSSEFMKTITMFTSDAMKVVGRVIDSFGKTSVIKARMRMTTDTKALETLSKQLKSARKEAIKSASALVTQAMFMALISEAFKHFYNRDEEDENNVKEFTLDTIGNLFGGLPIIKDLYGKLFEGYDFDSFAFSSINDLLEAVNSVVDLVSKGIKGELNSKEIASNLRKISYALGQIFGIPVRNVYNVFYGTSNLISPSFAYKMNDKFVKSNYSSDLKRAIAKEDDKMIATIVGLMTNESVGYFENSSTRQEINRLAQKDYDVLPQSISDTMTINETQYNLSASQKDDFRKVYEKSITAIDKLVSSNGYKVASDDAKAKAIKYVYRYYYYEAQAKTLNAELDAKLYLFGQIVSPEKLALAIAEAPLLVENVTDKKSAVQRYLQGSKLSAMEKYALMGYFGYKPTNGQSIVEGAISKTNLTKAQKKLLLEKCGY